jgi:pimeloyl-ACP methyl ester carboxylesterase
MSANHSDGDAPLSSTVVPALILPGLDGTRPLRARFVDLAPADHDAELLELPPDRGTFAALAEHFAKVLAPRRSGILIAESFAGPLAIMLAAEHLRCLSALVLVATFATSPAPSILRGLPWTLLVRMPLPSWALRLAMLDGSCSTQMVNELKWAIRSLPPDVLACRIREVLKTDVRAAFQNVQCPVLYVKALRDTIVPSRCVDEMRRLQPNTVICSIDGPHTLLECRPAEVWQNIAEFTRSFTSG